MLKRLSLMVGLALSIAGILPEIAAGEASYPSAYPVVPGANSGNLVCYMQTEDGQTLDLGRLCGDRTPSSSSDSIVPETMPENNGTEGSSSNPLSNSGLSRSASSEAQCVVFDAQGRPCAQ